MYSKSRQHWLLLLVAVLGAGFLGFGISRLVQGTLYNQLTIDCPPNRLVQLIGPVEGDGWLTIVDRERNVPLASRRIENIHKVEGFEFNPATGSLDYIWYNDSGEMQVDSLKVN